MFNIKLIQICDHFQKSTAEIVLGVKIIDQNIDF